MCVRRKTKTKAEGELARETGDRIHIMKAVNVQSNTMSSTDGDVVGGTGSAPHSKKSSSASSANKSRKRKKGKRTRQVSSDTGSFGTDNHDTGPNHDFGWRLNRGEAYMEPQVLDETQSMSMGRPRTLRKKIHTPKKYLEDAPSTLPSGMMLTDRPPVVRRARHDKLAYDVSSVKLSKKPVVRFDTLGDQELSNVDTIDTRSKSQFSQSIHLTDKSQIPLSKINVPAEDATQAAKNGEQETRAIAEL